MLFAGEEWGASTPFLYFTDHTDPKLGKAVSDGRRREFAAFGWNRATSPTPRTRRPSNAPGSLGRTEGTPRRDAGLAP